MNSNLPIRTILDLSALESGTLACKPSQDHERIFQSNIWKHYMIWNLRATYTLQLLRQKSSEMRGTLKHTARDIQEPLNQESSDINRAPTPTMGTSSHNSIGNPETPWHTQPQIWHSWTSKSTKWWYILFDHGFRETRVSCLGESITLQGSGHVLDDNSFISKSFSGRVIESLQLTCTVRARNSKDLSSALPMAVVHTAAAWSLFLVCQAPLP